MAQSEDAARRHAEEITALHRESEESVPAHQKQLERFTEAIATPRALYGFLFFALGWIAANTVGPRVGLPQFDPPPFAVLELIGTLASLLLVLLVLLKQERQAKVDQERSRLVLQVTMLTDRRSAKLVQLFERLREDLHLPERKDEEEEELRTAPDLRQQRDELVRTMSEDPNKGDDQV